MIRLKTFGSSELRHESGTPVAGDISRAKRLALLVYLGARPAGHFVRRDTLLALFWPDATEDRARHALRQSLYVLRQALGSGAIMSRGEEELALGSGPVQVDAREFAALLEEGCDEAAVALYLGDFLPGLHVPGAAPELEDWIAGERERYRGLAAAAGWRLAHAAATRGDAGLAAHRARWAASLTPFDEPSQRHLIELLARQGDRAGALLVYQQLTGRLDRELGTGPARATRELGESLRLRVTPLPPPQAPAPAPAPKPARVVAPRGARWRWTIPLVAATALLLLLAGQVRPAAMTPLLAVGPIEVIGPADTLLPPAAFASLLATSLARLPGARVLSSDRVREVAAELRESGGAVPTPSAAARSAGAEELMEGTLSREGDSVRLALRVVDLRNGLVLHVATAGASNPFVLVDRATIELAHQYGVTPPATGIAAVTTASAEAFGLYQEGLRRYYGNEPVPALRLFQSALEQDSTFAMAAFFAWRTAHAMEDTAAASLAPRAMRLSGPLPTVQRLWIQSELLAGANLPSWQALADSLALLNPANLDGILLAGAARFLDGDFLGGIPFYRTVEREDSLSLGQPGHRCLACEAREAIILSYEWADSLPAALREANAWRRESPHSERAAELEWEALRRAGRIGDARQLGDSIAGWLGDPSDATMRRALLALGQWDFAAADPALTALIRSGGRGYRDISMVLLAISLRTQGRFDEAIRLTAAGRLPDGTLLRGGWSSSGLIPHRASALIEAGRGREAVALYDSVVAHPPSDPGGAARHVAWNLTHLATALATLGDTARLASLADTIERASRGSSYGRDHRLAFYVRGLLRESRGDTAGARDLFDRALFSRTEGYGQISYRLAQCELALGRPERAIGLLEAVFRGPLDSGNLYLNRSDAARLLARAYAAAGRAERAAAERRGVERAGGRTHTGRVAPGS